MGAAIVDSASCDHHLLNSLHSESLPLVDLRLLSQSELLSLSICSSSVFSSLHHLRNDNDVSTPKIDRSVFNESAGSRKQTFSRLRLAPRNNSQFSSSSLSNRTPIPYQNIEQPLDDENLQIISVLQSLLGADSNLTINDDNLISVPVRYKEYLGLPLTSNVESQNVSIGIVDSAGGSEVKVPIPTVIEDSSSTKRKRGRPRKNVTNVINNNNDQVVESKWNENKKIFMKENVVVECEEKEELVMVNKNAVVVDLTALGSVEDPYGGELMRRTAGMQTEAELLVFLQGLEGERGSRRNRRKIVDASVFGDALPIGWKLMLCVKKKAGFAWLDCRRYISPNGKQFVSYMEVSTYLSSFPGLPGASLSSIDNLHGSVQLTDKISSGNAADPSLKDGNNGDGLLCHTVLPVPSKSTEQGNLATSLWMGSVVEAQPGRKFNCHKCPMVFDEQDDLLQHLLSSHHRTSKKLRCGTSAGEGLIIKNGKYECQFCDKAFEEKHRYYGHLGIHIKSYFKRLEASSGNITIQKSSDSKIQKSIGVAWDSVAVSSNIKTSYQISSAIPYSEAKTNTFGEIYHGKYNRECSINYHKAEKMNESRDFIATEVSVCLDAEPALLKDENNAIHKPLDETDICEGTESAISSGQQETSFLTCSLAAAGRDPAFTIDNNKSRVCAHLMEEHNLERGSKSGLAATNAEVKTSGDEKFEDGLHSSTMDEMEIVDFDLVGKGEQVTSCGKRCTAEENVATGIEELRSSADCSALRSGNDQRYGCVDIAIGLLPSIMLEAGQKSGSKACLLSSVDQKTSIENNLNIGSKVDKGGKSENNEFTIRCASNNTVPVEDNLTNIEQGGNYGQCSVVPSQDVENDRNVTRKTHNPCREQESKGREFSSTAVKVSNSTIEAPEHDQVPCSNNSEFSSDSGLIAGRLTIIEQERNSNSCLVVPSVNVNKFASKDYGVCKSTWEKLVQGRNFECTQSYHVKTHDDENSMNKVSCITTEEHKSSSNGELNIAVGHGLSEHGAYTVTSIVQEQCSKGAFVLSENQQAFAANDSVTSLCSGTLDEVKRVRDSVDILLHLSGSEQGQTVGNNLHGVSTGAVQGDHRYHDLKNSRKFSGHLQPKWRTDEANDLLSGFADPSSLPVQTSACFPAYDLMFRKGENEIFGEKFGGVSGFEGQRLGSTQNMEYNFLTSQVSSCSDQPKVISYNADMAQGFDSSVWIEKEAVPMLPERASRLQIPTMCVWCRIELQPEVVESEAQTGSMGFMCPVCKAKISGQFSLL